MSNTIVQEIAQAKFTVHNGRLVAPWENGAGYYHLHNNVVTCFMFIENCNAAPCHYSNRSCSVESVHRLSIS